jgi:multiple sugar transport system substrate-binding protein
MARLAGAGPGNTKVALSRRRLLLLAAGMAGGAGIGVLAGCGAPATTAAVTASVTTPSLAASSAIAATPVPAAVPTKAAAATSSSTIDFFFPNWGEPTIYEAQEQHKIDAYEKQYAERKITPVPVASDYDKKLTALFAAGTPPTTFWSDHQLVFSYAKKGMLDDLQPFARQDKSFDLNALPAVTREGLIMGDKLFALAGWAFTNVYFYNADLYRQAGLDSPYDLWKQDKWTWDVYIEAATKLTKRDGTKTTQQGSDLGLSRLWINTAGGQEYDSVKAPTKCLYDTDVDMAGLQFSYDMGNKYRIYDANFYKDSGQKDATTAFTNGKQATMSRWITGIANFKAIQDFTWGAVPYAKKQAYASDYTHWAYGMAKGLTNASRRDAGWQWLKWYTGEGGQEMEAKDLGAVPFTKQAQAVFTQALQQLPKMEHPEAISEILNAYPNSRLISVDVTDISKLLNQNMAPFWAGKSDAKTTTTAATEQVNSYLQAHPQTF